MQTNHRRGLVGLLAGGLALALITGCQTPVDVSSLTEKPAAKLTPAAAQQMAVDAYVYGYPLVTLELTRRVMTNVKEADGRRAPMGQFALLRDFPNPYVHEIAAPNADTLDISAWLDVSKEPYVLSLPNARNRYYFFPMLDGWTEVFQTPGKRVTGTGPQTYAITGPGWTGTLPEGVTEYKSPTSLVWIAGHIYCSGQPEDYNAAHEQQDKTALVPLSVYDQPYTPPPGDVDPNIDMATPVRDQVNALNTQDYFSLLAKLMKSNPPAAADAPMIQKMAALGIIPGGAFDLAKLGPDVAAALQNVPELGLAKIMAWSGDRIAADDATRENGWRYTIQTGFYGTNYLQRALIAATDLGASRPEDTVCCTSDSDADGQPYSGANQYVLHFAKGQLPPVEAFWSLTMYDGSDYFVENPLARYSINARQALTLNEDGSLDIYLQNEDPGADKASNWLPAPKDRFILRLRLYWPKETPPSILDGSWKIPPVRKVESPVASMASHQ